MMRLEYGWLAAAALLITPHFSLAADSHQLADLLRAAQAKAQTNDVAATRAAFAPVFAVPGLTIQQRIAAHLEIARVLQRAKTPSLSEALKEYETALAIPNLPDTQRFKILFAVAKAHFDSNFTGSMPSYRDDGFAAAAAVYRRIAADPAADNGARVAALGGIADCAFEKMDVQGANAALLQAAALPDLRADERNLARYNLARGYQRQLAYAKARGLYEAILADRPAPDLQAEIEGRVADILAADGQLDDAVRYLRGCRRTELDIAAFCQKHAGDEAALAIYRKLVEDTRLDDNVRWPAFEKATRLIERRGEFSAIKGLYEAFMPGFRARNPNRDILSRYLQSPEIVAHDDAFLAWAAEEMLRKTPLAEKDALLFNSRLFDALLALGQTARAEKVARSILALPHITPAMRVRQQLVAAVLAGADRPEETQNAANAILASFSPKDVSSGQRADALLQAARAAMWVRHYSAARELDALREKLLVPEPRRSLPCEFIGNAPRDVSEFLASPPFNDLRNRGKLDRKYGDNLQFLLETDSSTAGRNVTAGNEGADTTEFCVTCDADGLSIFTLAPSAHLDELADGLAEMGGYEMYLAPGAHQAYITFLVDLPGGKTADNFITMYGNRHFRPALLREGTVKSETRVTPKGVATLIFLSWELFYDKLPENGDRWQFENIHWERGGYSWGGSKSVHNRSSFGDLVFANMTRENLNHIKRRIVVKALARYRREATGKTNGLIDFWQDPELGDREFYASELRPLVKRLNEQAGKVKKGMTAEDAETVFSQAVPDWMEFRYKVGELRRNYLDAKRIGGK